MPNKSMGRESFRAGTILPAMFDAALHHPPTKQVMSCSGAYEKFLKKESLRLDDCIEGLRKSVVELRNASSSAKFWNNAIVASRFVAIGCDCILTTFLPVALSAKDKDKVFEVGLSAGKAVVKASTGQFSKADAWLLLAENKAKIIDITLEMYDLKKVAHVGKAFAYLQSAKDFHDAVLDWKEGSGGLDSQVIGTVKWIQKLEGQLGTLKVELRKCGVAV